MKKKEIQAMSVAELQGRIKEEKETLAKLQLTHAVSAIESPAKLRTTRRTIARLMTELRKKEIAGNN